MQAKKKKKVGCWCSYCRFVNRTSWWKNKLQEKDLKRETKNAIQV